MFAPQQPNAFAVPQQQQQQQQQNALAMPQQQQNAFAMPQQQQQQQNACAMPQQQQQQNTFAMPQQQQQQNAFAMPQQQQQQNAFAMPQQQQQQKPQHDIALQNRLRAIHLAYAAFVDPNGFPTSTKHIPNEEKCEFDAIMYNRIVNETKSDQKKYQFSKRRQEEVKLFFYLHAFEHL
jgi:hypothetical protein